MLTWSNKEGQRVKDEEERGSGSSPQEADDGHQGFLVQPTVPVASAGAHSDSAGGGAAARLGHPAQCCTLERSCRRARKSEQGQGGVRVDFAVLASVQEGAPVAVWQACMVDGFWGNGR